jgi:hypothetical protein
MDFLKDRRVVALIGAGAALAAGLVIAFVILRRSPAPAEPPPAAEGGLVVVSGRDDDQKLDPKRPLRCFVGGQFVGELPLEVCAQRNGVATGALDVGLDQAGALAATNGASSAITPLPPMAPPQSQPLTEAAPPEASNAVGASAQGEGPRQDCWRYGAGGWDELPTPQSMMGCVRALFSGHCPPAGSALYGRWDDQTLRLMNGAVEASANNRDFHDLVHPWAACAASAAEPARPGL